MPELPEVETTRRGIMPHLLDRTITEVVVRQPQLRWPIPPRLKQALRGERVRQVERRAKYLLVGIGRGTLIVHLGMSGSLRVLADSEAPGPHDHVDLCLDDGALLRYRDPRRFGAVLWTTADVGRHPLLDALGPEPFDDRFDGAYLYAKSRGRSTALRNFLLDGRLVAGVGNIYANEACFRVGVRPDRAAGRIARVRYDALASAIKEILAQAIEVGGTTLRDFTHADGKPGYFQQELQVYGREGEPCPHCRAQVQRAALGGRSIFYCKRCQR